MVVRGSTVGDHQMMESHNARSDAAAQRKTSGAKYVRVCARAGDPMPLARIGSVLTAAPPRRCARKQCFDKRGIQTTYGDIKNKRWGESECGAGGFETRPYKRTEASYANAAPTYLHWRQVIRPVPQEPSDATTSFLVDRLWRLWRPWRRSGAGQPCAPMTSHLDQIQPLSFSTSTRLLLAS